MGLIEKYGTNRESVTLQGTPVEPFLLALATTANIGSAIALTGNPQNVLVGNYSGISYFAFITYMVWQY
eukprot:SAG31_NODE_1314_length_8851_cov_7.233318_3_plen_69_part_00